MNIDLWPDRTIEDAGPNNAGCPSATLYPAPGEGVRPTVVVCPGGAYYIRAEHEGEPVARWLNSLGITALVLHYRVFPHRYPAPLDDARRAVQTVRHRAAEWGVDPLRIGLLGFSAGGHLAASAALHPLAGSPDAADPIERHSSAVNVLVLGYPVVSFAGYPDGTTRRNLLGNTPDPELVELLSCEKQVTPKTPPVFLWHTVDDEVVPVTHSLLLAAELDRQGVPFAAHFFASGRHGLGLAEEHRGLRDWTKLCAAWLAAQGFGGGPAEDEQEQG